jgi:hypothetical protein
MRYPWLLPGRSSVAIGFLGAALALAGFAAAGGGPGAIQSDTTDLRVPRDFKLDLLYTVPGESEGSWVAICVDPQGRLIVGDQNGKLYRVALPTVDRTGPITPEPIDLDIGGAHGLLHAFGSLYVMVNEGSRPHGLYRVRDTNGDDRYDEVQLLRQMDISGEHGGHSIVLSPDGQSLYVVVGNQSTLTPVNASRVPPIWSEDNLLPRIPTGFMDNSLAPQGWIARTDPEGRDWELIAAGFRNQFDAAFSLLIRDDVTAAETMEFAQALAAQGVLAVDSLTDEQCDQIEDDLGSSDWNGHYNKAAVRAALRRCATTGEPEHG